MKPLLYPKLFYSAVLCFVLIATPFLSYAQPANDNCSNAINRNSNTNCNTNNYSLQNATVSSFTIIGTPCVVGTHYDVWFSFTASGTVQTATISNVESGITKSRSSYFQRYLCRNVNAVSMWYNYSNCNWFNHWYNLLCACFKCRGCSYRYQ